MTRAVIFANGEMADRNFVISMLNEGDIIVAADGGLTHILALGLKPSVMIGDLDSTPRELVQLMRNGGVEVIEHPTDKDRTDLELALDLIQERGVDDVVIVGALGGRLDHGLANVLLPSATSRPAMNIRIVEVGFEVATVRSKVTLHGAKGDTVTLVALSHEVAGVSTENLRYSLAGEALLRGSSRGVSNVMLSDTAEVSCTSGVLLVIRVAAMAEEEESG